MDIYNGTDAQAGTAAAWGDSKGDLLRPTGRDNDAVQSPIDRRDEADVVTLEEGR
jgi:hypothetical protein